MTEVFRLSDIKPNPFRHMDRYPIQEKKIAALKESIETTGFWDNLVARIGDDGKPQIAYGHHRWQTLLKVYAKTHQINLIIRELSDDMMLKIMARENMEEWGSSAAVEQETVRAVVQAYADGLIELGSIPENVAPARRRYAPGFVQGGERDTSPAAPYTGQQVADYLGWHVDKVKDALGALELISDGSLTESDFDGLSTSEAERVVREARKAKAERVVREKEQRRKAEAAQKAAEAAEKARAKAEADAERRRAQATKAAEKDRVRRQQEAEAAAQEAREAKAERDRQKALQQEANERAATAREEGRKQASTAGKEASRGLKGGKGVKDPDLVKPPRGRKNTAPPPHISRYATNLCGQLDKLMYSDDCAKRFNEVLQYKQHLDPQAILDLDHHLGKLADRVAAARNKLGANHARNNNTTIDAEIIEAEVEEITA